MKVETPDKLALLVDHGFIPTGKTGTQVYGNCPFCGKEKFYASIESGQWHCKHGKCDRDGNLTTFLDQVIDHYTLPKKLLGSLSKVRGLPKSILKKYPIVYDGRRYLLGTKWTSGHIQDIGKYTVGSKIRATKGTPKGVGLLNIEKLEKVSLSTTVYICAGYWDTLAMECILKEAKATGIVVGVPGENVFKKEWIEHFQGRDVVLCYDSDEAGDKGMAKVGGCESYPKPSSKLSEGLLRGVASKIKYVNWSLLREDKIDVNEFYKMGGTYANLQKLLKSSHRRDAKPVIEKKDKKGKSKASKALSRKKLTFDKVLSAYSSRLNMSQGMVSGLRLTYATVASIRFASDPVWIYLVAPSGGGKTVLLSSLRGSERVVYRSSLSKATLVSGMRGTKDPSLIPDLDGKCFVLKDFTEVLAMSEQDREEVIGTLRGIFDGYLDKSYGTGVHRHYNSLFSIVAGVTHRIHRFTDMGAALGDRFLKFDMTRGEEKSTSKIDGPSPILMAAQEGLEVEQVEDETLVNISTAFLSRISKQAEKRKTKMRTPRSIKERISYLGVFIAALRTSIDRSYQGDLEARPVAEVPTRMVKQLSKLSWGLALVDGKKQPDEETYEEIREVGLDTAFGMRRDVVLALLKRGKKGATLTKLESMVKLPSSTLRERLADLELLGIAEKSKLDRPADPSSPSNLLGGAKQTLWKASKRMRNLWELV